LKNAQHWSLNKSESKFMLWIILNESTYSESFLKIIK